MTSFQRTLALATTSIAIATTATAGENQPMTQEQKDVLAVVERMTEAFQARDLGSIMASYEPGAAIAFEPGQPVSDPAALRQMFEGFFALSPRFDYAGHDVLIAGDLAVHIAPWTMNGKTPEGDPVKQGGLSVAVLRRQPDGSWRMAIDNPHGGRLLVD